MAVKIFALNPGTQQSFTIPAGVTSIQVEAIGGGGRGAISLTQGNPGGGGGAYASSTGISVIPGSSYYVQVGLPNATTTAASPSCQSWGNTSNAAPTSTSTGAKADCGTAGSGTTTVGVGGLTANSIGTTTFAGGNGGSSTSGAAANNGGGGGGAAGPGGAGKNGGDGNTVASTGCGGGGGAGGASSTVGTTASGTTAGAGGAGPGGTGGGTAATSASTTIQGGAGTTGSGGGGGGGYGNNIASASGGDGATYNYTTWATSGYGPGGGGGGGSDTTINPGGNGGLYGAGGGGGGNALIGLGARGIVVVTYTPAALTTRYWVGGTGTWDTTTTTHWSATSGGASGASVPDASTNVIFDSSSGSGTVTLTGTLNCASITTTGSSFTFSSSGALKVLGNFTLSATTVWSATSSIFISETSTITTNGVSLPCALNLSQIGATYYIANDITFSGSNGLTFSSGTLDLTNNGVNSGYSITGAYCNLGPNLGVFSIVFGTTGNFNVTGSGLALTVAGGGSLGNFSYTGTPRINITYSGATAMSISFGGFTETNALPLNITAGTYTLSLLGGGVFKSLDFTGFTGTFVPGTGTCTFYGNLTLVSGMTFTTGSGIWTFAATSGTQVITSAGKTLFSITQDGVGGTVQLPAGTTTLSSASAATYTLTNGTLDLGTNTATLLCGAFSSDNSNTRSIIFGTGNISISSVTASTIWALATITGFTYTGTPTVNILSGATTTNLSHGSIAGGSLTNAVDFNFSAGAYQLTFSPASFVRSLTFSGTYTGIFYLPNTMTVFGDITFIPGMTVFINIGVSGGSTITIGANSSAATQTITSAGKTFDNITITAASSSTVLFSDSSSLNGTLTHTIGTLDANNQSHSWNAYSSNGANLRTFNMGSGTFTINSWNTQTASNYTLNIGTSSLVMAGNNSAAFDWICNIVSTSLLTLPNITFGGSSNYGTLALFGTIVCGTFTCTKTSYTIIGATTSGVSSQFTLKCTTLSLSSSSGNSVGLQGSPTLVCTLDVTNPFTLDYASVAYVEPLTSGIGTLTNSTLFSNTPYTSNWALNTTDTIGNLLIGTTPYSAWTVPTWWNNSNNSVHVIGPGGYGATAVISAGNGGSGGGGGGGGYTKATNVSLTTGSTIAYSSGLAPASTTTTGNNFARKAYFNGTANTITSVATSTNTLAVAGLTNTITVPAGTLDGDLMILFIVSTSASATIAYTGATGWTAVNAGTFQGRGLWYKIASSEPASYTITYTVSSVTTAYMLTYRNAIWDTTGMASATAVNVVTPTAISMSSPSSLLLNFANGPGNTGYAVSTPTGFTSLVAVVSTAGAPSSRISTLSGQGPGTSVNPSTTFGSAATGFAFLVSLAPTYTGTYEATPGKNGSATATSTAGGAGGVGSGGTLNYTGGTGGAGALRTVASYFVSGGGGAGAAGPNGNGATGGVGRLGTTVAVGNFPGGGGGGNGGGTVGASGAGTGNGGNNSLGIGGSVAANMANDALPAVLGGGGGAGYANVNTASSLIPAAGGSGADVVASLYGGGGGGGGAGPSRSSAGATGGTYGGGGGGGGIYGSNNFSTSGGAPGAGAIIVLSAYVAPSTSPSNFFLLF